MTAGRDLERVPSGVPGLDVVLRGGFPRGGIYILQGAPGTGKTVLANQLCYHEATRGGRALYVTLLAENHTRMLVNLGTLSFFDPSRLPDHVTYISALSVLESGGLPGLAALLRREIVAHKSTIMVLDGMVAVEDRAASNTDFKKFIQELQVQAGLHGCTIFLITTGKGERIEPEHTMVDGILELADLGYGSRGERALFVRKLRGSDYLPGRHAFGITEDGVVVSPRIEAVFHHPSRPDEARSGWLTSGIPALDAMLGGGFPEAAVAGLLGPTGIGKTTLGLHFLSAASAAEPGLLFGLYETPARLVQKAASLGLDLKGVLDRGDVEILWQPQGEHLLDSLAHHLLDAVARRDVRRLFLDGLGALMEASIEPTRTGRFFSALVNELRARGVTVLYTMETHDVIGHGVQVPISNVSAIGEGLIAMRYLESRSRARRLLSVLKVSHSAFDPTLREFVINSGSGISILGAFETEEELLSGIARDRRVRERRSSGPED